MSAEYYPHDTVKIKLGVYSKVIYGDVVDYTGSYEITPSADKEQELETKGKRMTNNVVCHQIPTYETSNDYGQTFYIASEV